MAKTTALGWGAAGSNALDAEFVEAQEELWAGKLSSRSERKPAKKSASRQASPQSPARKTEPPSKKDRTGNVSADSADDNTKG